jgi:purine-binding chemotaxis protein CheW
MKAGAFDWTAARARVERFQEALERGEGRSPAERERILRERAERLACPQELPGSALAGDGIVVFRIGAERYGLPLSRMVEIISRPLCAAVPGAPDRLAGVIQVRGEIRPVLDLAQALRVQRNEPPERHSVLLVRGSGREFGVRVDEVEDIRVLTENERGPAPAGAGRVMWMTPDGTGVLNADMLLDEVAQ